MALRKTSDVPVEGIVDINTTPLIDVMLVLLVTLIVTLPIQTHAVKLQLPQRPTEMVAPPPVVDLEVDFDGSLRWNGNLVPSRTQLQEYFRLAAAEPAQPEIHIRPNRLAKYGVVARVLSDAQRLGVEKIGFAGTEVYLEE